MSGIDDDHVLARRSASRAHPNWDRDGCEDDHTFALAVALHDRDAEPMLERLHVRRRRLGAEREPTLWSRSSADGGVASTYDSARPTVLKYVAPNRRMSGMNSDAENVRRIASVAPLVSAGTKLAASALPWNSGIGQYSTSSAVNGIDAPKRA